MKILETERLILREFTKNDFTAVHNYASCMENVIYTIWGPNTKEQTKDFIDFAISKANENPCTDYQYAVDLKNTGNTIGACNLTLSFDEAEIGWILHQDHWKKGYGPEIGKALLKFGFEELNLHRITAHCDVENYGSYRVMEKIGMRREGIFIEGRVANKISDKKYGDELSYAILKDEWETKKKIEYYNHLPVIFDDFIKLPKLSDGEIYLVCTAKNPAIPEKKFVPAYSFAICKDGEKIGEISLRIGYTDGLFYGGQIGYNIDEKYRGNGYAARACRLLAPVAKAHGMGKLLITNDHANIASQRVCEKLGARLIYRGRTPEWHDLYKEGHRFGNVYEWSVE
ncbi:MAG: GNAT family N-acetyltransferase [Oscillospiraceae bacterium]|nr:GNAT family N-acetyltransferase [Oscillospiraceae bacterium]